MSASASTREKRPAPATAAGAAQHASKKAASDDALTAYFGTLSGEMDEQNDRRERLISLSRSITKHAKRVISLLQRFNGANGAELLQQADAMFAALLAGELAQLRAELAGQDYWRHQRSFSACLQEWVEAASFAHYLRHGTLLSLADAQRLVSPLALSLDDYVGGIADLSGELMRVVVSAAGRHDSAVARAATTFTRTLYGEFAKLAAKSRARDAAKKTEVMQQSLQKMERICFEQRLKDEDRTSVQPEAEAVELDSTKE